MKHYSGFSLIELMIVVAIVSILTAIAIPTYQDYTKRARFVEVLTATEPYKTAITIAIQQGQPLTELKNNEHGIPSQAPATKNLASLKVDKGIITAQGSERVDSATYVLKPDPDTGHWSVSGTCLKMGFCED